MESGLLPILRRGMSDSNSPPREPDILLMRAFQSGKCHLEKTFRPSEVAKRPEAPRISRAAARLHVYEISFLAYLARCARRELMGSVTPHGDSANVSPWQFGGRQNRGLAWRLVRIRQSHVPIVTLRSRLIIGKVCMMLLFACGYCGAASIPPDRVALPTFQSACASLNPHITTTVLDRMVRLSISVVRRTGIGACEVAFWSCAAWMTSPKT
jgi:hypothetical protein